MYFRSTINKTQFKNRNMKLHIVNIYILHVDIPFDVIYIYKLHRFGICQNFRLFSVISRIVLKLYYQIQASIIFVNMHYSLCPSLGLHNISETQYNILKKKKTVSNKINTGCPRNTATKFILLHPQHPHICFSCGYIFFLQVFSAFSSKIKFKKGKLKYTCEFRNHN